MLFKKKKSKAALSRCGGWAVMEGHRQGRHPPVAWTASIVVSRRGSMVYQGGFEMQVHVFRHSAAGGKKRRWGGGGGFVVYIKCSKQVKNNCVFSFLGRSFLKVCRGETEAEMELSPSMCKGDTFFSSLRNKELWWQMGISRVGRKRPSHFLRFHRCFGREERETKQSPSPSAPTCNIHERFTSETVLEVKICMQISGTIDISICIGFFSPK